MYIDTHFGNTHYYYYLLIGPPSYTRQVKGQNQVKIFLSTFRLACIYLPNGNVRRCSKQITEIAPIVQGPKLLI